MRGEDLSEPPGDKEDINSNTTSKRSTSHPPNQPIRTVAQSNTNGKRPERNRIGLTTQAVVTCSMIEFQEEEKDASTHWSNRERDQVELLRVIKRLEKGLRHLIEENGKLIEIKFEGLVEIERLEKQKLNKLLKDFNRLLRLESDKRSNQPKKQESALDELCICANIKVRNNGILIRTGNSVPIIMTAQADTRRTDVDGWFLIKEVDGYDHYLENKRTGQMEESAIVGPKLTTSYEKR
ncbi:hypothetical protein BY996DRAFT_6504719 [Phakopsora pachyrhizi]|nr:hypothetical protein BY996DRAFT_6504719 [Phakopsora pachyrhizi]